MSKIINDVDSCTWNDMLIYENENGEKNELSWRYLLTQPDEERSKMAVAIFKFFREYGIRINVPDKQLKNHFERVKKNVIELDESKSIPNTNSSGTLITKHFCPNFLKLGGRKRRSPFDCIVDDELFMRTIENRIGNTLFYKGRQWPMNISPQMILHQGPKCSGLAASGSNFKPVIAKFIYEKFNTKKIYDYSCGYGSRLIGAMAAKNRPKYFGVEPCEETYNGLLDMVDYFDWKDRASIYKDVSENFTLNERVDLAFSSPPYFDTEVYSNEDDQCYNKFSDYEVWLEGYWRETVRRVKEFLENDGIFSVNVGNNSNKTMSMMRDDIISIVEQEGFLMFDVWWMRTSRSHLSGKKKLCEREGADAAMKPEGIYFFRRG